MHRSVFERVGGFSSAGRGHPEDQEFILRHVFEFGGKVFRVDKVLLLYRFHEGCETLGVAESSIWKIRLEFLEKYFLSNWRTFSIWSAGKQGRRLFRDLAGKHQKSVEAFCDVDEKKIGKHYEYQETKIQPRPKYPIVHFSNVKPPFVVAVKTDLHEGGLEENIRSLNLEEGRDFVHFG